ncbi:nitric oxide reductase activation protein NorD [Marinobacter sp. UBA3607]|jgi:nitric oxide reductase NorD protein|uniref:nitric oxide reductase activation protein NorD n=1 Tax=Marinobacter sp. UBA3607 TaxID=1946820 RepID=UPI002579A401|nr:VWA domain-containing protein [Marinobacter sp. UBA3607]|tara:strand:+ start:1503 stop:3326 length:1824 start_codon:yes stop_codon:yes gene_type:complete
MEEWVGLKWHDYVTRQAMGEFPEYAVHLKDEARTLGVLFRAMGGDPALSLVTAEPRHFQIRRKFLQKLAGTHRKFELAWRDEESLRLPDRLALFPSRKVNRELYLWLAALASLGEINHHSWLKGNQAMVQQLLERWPGLEPMYQRLVKHTLRWRPEPESLRGSEAEREAAIRQALIHPGSVDDLPDALTDPWPVVLWLYPVLGRGKLKGQIIGDDNTMSKSGGLAKKRKRRRAERVDAFDKDQGLMLFRLESLFSWSEFIPIDRAGDDSEEEDADAVADDMDMISVSQDRREASSAIKFDLDLPSEENDDLHLGPGIHLPEWDWRRQDYREKFCCLQPLLSKDAVPSPLPEHLNRSAQTLRRQFSALKPLRQWERRQLEGEELDLDACLERMVQHKRGIGEVDQKLFRQCKQNQRDLACLVLTDISLSTDTYINNHQRVIDIARDGLQLLSEALTASRDPFALFAFSSRRRDHIRFHHIKSFEEPYNDTTRGRIQALEPGYYTRMGAAIRQSIKLLQARPEHQKILLLLTDGKPNDLDLYEGRYGVEDTRMAVQEAHKAGLTPFCVTIDEEANEYLPYVFGSSNFVVIKDPTQLPGQLPKLYMNLTR